MSAWEKLKNHPMLRSQVLLSDRDHGFLDGSQHMRKDRNRQAQHSTSIFFLQNEAGMKKWPVSKNLVGALKAAFAKGVPTDAQAERMQLRDMRAKYNNKKWKFELERTMRTNLMTRNP